MIDGSSVGEKYWTFSLTPPYVGLATEYQGRTPTTAPCSGVPSSTAMTQNLYSWNLDSAGDPYIGTVVTTLDQGQSYAVQSTTTQTMDVHGNVTQVVKGNYSGLPVRPRAPTTTPI